MIWNFFFIYLSIIIWRNFSPTPFKIVFNFSNSIKPAWDWNLKFNATYFGLMNKCSIKWRRRVENKDEKFHQNGLNTVYSSYTWEQWYKRVAMKNTLKGRRESYATSWSSIKRSFQFQLSIVVNFPIEEALIKQVTAQARI